MNAFTREDFQKLDHDDPLACFREEFYIPQGVIYMDGNSLGAGKTICFHGAYRCK
jgi:kynureninase